MLLSQFIEIPLSRFIAFTPGIIVLSMAELKYSHDDFLETNWTDFSLTLVVYFLSLAQMYMNVTMILQ